jgi:hypothetical protein
LKCGSFGVYSDITIYGTKPSGPPARERGCMRDLLRKK